ncbi:flippase-like domain-containing protein [Pseudidiomarina sp. 1ASP75-14]|uniref:lysylphosphatidylglycerol synthase transmembrane domain-containing protein n=1 Tax=Pseudidiomarina terrestris TaxID=2820060 RepID=UPI002654064E|nr:lysylphosphatidylglycerol synthase transmembrane domain-containing protein [Pseudidiomarina sp. 1ASP75-14]MDN7137230.1 flippase-like domain-containing protein [Pseudidiomarina sp. 1ASP75-14]
MSRSMEEERQSEHHTPKFSWQRLAVFAALFTAFTLAGFYAVFDHFSGRTFSFDTRLLQPGVILATLVLLLVYFTADGLRLYYTLVALGARIPATAMAKLVFINIFFSNITPMATGGGFAQVWFLHDHGISVGRATAATTIRTVLAILFIFSLTPVLLFLLPTLGASSLSSDIGTALLVVAILYFTFFAVVLLRAQWLITPVTLIIQRLQVWGLISEQKARLWYFKVMREVLRFARSFSVYCKGPKTAIALSVLATGVFLLCLFSFPALLMWGLGYDVPYLTSVGLLVVTTFIMYFSPTPGASGISEGVFGSFFNDLLAHEHLLLVTFSWRFLTIYLGMILGLFILQRYLITRSQCNGEAAS